MSDTILSVDGLVKRFAPRSSGFRRKADGDGHLAVDNVSFSVGRGEVLGIAGASGSGKTTVARCLVRLVEPDSGTVDYGGADVLAARGNDLRELRRRMQMIYQNPYSSLNPRMTVGDAILEAGRVHKRPGSERGDTFVEEFLDLVHLSSGTAQRYPRELSGGQRQRVALGRAIVREPSAFLMDEPLSNLDAALRVQTRAEILKLQQRLGTTTLYVTHDQTEAMTLGDRVAVMRGGIVQQVVR